MLLFWRKKQTKQNNPESSSKWARYAIFLIIFDVSLSVHILIPVFMAVMIYGILYFSTEENKHEKKWKQTNFNLIWNVVFRANLHFHGHAQIEHYFVKSQLNNVTNLFNYLNVELVYFILSFVWRWAIAGHLNFSKEQIFMCNVPCVILFYYFHVISYFQSDYVFILCCKALNVYRK